jgi:hypothetical protein
MRDAHYMVEGCFYWIGYSFTMIPKREKKPKNRKLKKKLGIFFWVLL